MSDGHRHTEENLKNVWLCLQVIWLQRYTEKNQILVTDKKSRCTLLCLVCLLIVANATKHNRRSENWLWTLSVQTASRYTSQGFSVWLCNLHRNLRDSFHTRIVVNAISVRGSTLRCNFGSVHRPVVYCSSEVKSNVKRKKKKKKNPDITASDGTSNILWN